MRVAKVIVWLMMVCSAAWVRGQAPDSTAQPKGIEFHTDIPDSVLKASIFQFHLVPLQVKFDSYEHPGFSPTAAQFHNPLDAFNGNYYLAATELGHPHLELFRDYGDGPGLAYRPCTFPGFYKQPENVTLYQAQKPYTILAYHSSTKKDYQLHVAHTQNITERWNMAVDYHLFRPEGTYVNSSASDHLLDFSTNYYSRDARYQLAAGIITQKYNLGENGGLATDSIYTLRIEEEEGSMPVNESLRHSLTRDLSLYAHQSFNTVRQTSWVRPVKQPTADSAGRLRDSIVGYDTLQPHTPHVFNSGLFALDAQFDRQQYRYIDSTRYSHFTGRLYWTNDAYLDARWRNPFKLTLGIRPEADRLELHDSARTTVAVVTDAAAIAFARTSIALGRRADLLIHGEQLLGTSEYMLDAALCHRFGSDSSEDERSIRLEALANSISPDLIYLVRAADDASARNIETQRVAAAYQGSNLCLLAAANRISRNTWLDDQLRTVQSDGSALLLQGSLSAQLQFGIFHFDMQQLVQHSSDQDQIRVPLLASKNSLYADFDLFHGALRTQAGADIRYHTPFKADGYDPSMGVFYRQNESEVGGYLYGDIFVNLQIKRASIYVKAGHLNSLFEQQSHCVLPHYPMRGFGVYYGLIWQFFD